MDLCSLEPPLSNKRKGNETAVGLSRKTKRRTRWTIQLGADVELWKLEFAAVALGRRVTVANTTQDHDTSLAQLSEESSDAIRDLLVMHQVQVSIVILVLFYLAFLLTFSQVQTL